MPPLNGNSPAAAPLLTVSAPGRICLFGEHQDYLGLPVIAAAINLRVRLDVRESPEPGLHICMPDIESEDHLNPNQEIRYRHRRDYLAATCNILRRDGLSWDGGWRIDVSSTIPINSGASSSSALQVAWGALLLYLANDPRAEDPVAVARLAHQSEVTEFGAPGGMMDHFASALGDIIWLDCRPPYAYECLTADLGEFVLVDSGIPKDTNGVLGEKRRLVEGLGLDYHELPTEADAVEQRIAQHQDAKTLHLYEATLWNRYLTNLARKRFEEGMQPSELGSLLTRHHEQLSRNLGISLQEIDDLLQMGVRCGALGGKINGSGGGGSFFLHCPDRATEVCRLYQDAGYEAFVVKVGEGYRIDTHVTEEVPSP